MPKQAGSFDETLEQVNLGEQTNFDSCWVAEHHVQRTDEAQYWPGPLVRLSAIAARTDELELVTGVFVLPLRNAVEVAQKCAVIDHISEGRITIGIGLGYVPEEYEAYGVSMEDRSGRLVEGLQVMDALLSSSSPINYDGKFYSLSDWQPYPQSIQEPRPTLLLGGYGDLALKRSIRLADGWVPGFTAEIERIATKQKTLRKIADSNGIDWDSRDNRITREVIVADRADRAHELAVNYIHQTFLQKFGGANSTHPFITADQLENFEELAEGRFLVGTPEEVVEQIEHHKSELDIDHICCRFHHPRMPSDAVMRSIELFGDEVIPEFH